MVAAVVVVVTEVLGVALDNPNEKEGADVVAVVVVTAVVAVDPKPKLNPVEGVLVVVDEVVTA